MNRITPHLDSDSTIDLARQIELDRLAVVDAAKSRQADAARRCRWAGVKIILGIFGLALGSAWGVQAALVSQQASLGHAVGMATIAALWLMQSGLDS